jgi:hypothetical protein
MGVGNEGQAEGGAMDAKHTPGPWLVREFPGQRGRFVTDARPDEGGRFVGQLIAVETTDPRTAANLALIAAAPALLDQIRRDADRFRSYAKHCREYGWQETAKGFDDFAAEAESTIANATGNQPD